MQAWVGWFPVRLPTHNLYTIHHIIYVLGYVPICRVYLLTVSLGGACNPGNLLALNNPWTRSRLTSSRKYLPRYIT